MLRWLRALLRRRLDHVPRAEQLVLALPPAPRSRSEAVMCGGLTFAGTCTRCGSEWPACRDHCVREVPMPRPPITMATGSGESCPR